MPIRYRSAALPVELTIHTKDQSENLENSDSDESDESESDHFDSESEND